MTELKKIADKIADSLQIEFAFYKENTKPQGIPVCERLFENVTDDGSNTFFRFTFKGTGYIGVIKGATQTELGYATLLPSYIESFIERETELSKTEHLKRILLGECSSMSVYKYATKYSVRGLACFDYDFLEIFLYFCNLTKNFFLYH